MMILLNIIIVINLNCGIGTIAGGVSEETNARVSGKVFDAKGKALAGAEVVLRRLMLSSTGDTILSEKKTFTNDTGSFFFDTVSDGKYALLCFTADEQYGIKSKVALRAFDTLRGLSVTAVSPTVLKGRILLPDTLSHRVVRVGVPGMNKAIPVDGNGFYRIDSVPIGQYDIAYYQDGVVNLLPLLTKESGKDTTFIKDVRLHNDSNGAAMPYAYFPTTVAKSYSIVPIEYKPTNEPTWYYGNDFDAVTYFRGVGDSLTQYTPHIVQVLYVAQTTSGINLDDQTMIAYLEKQTFTVFVVDDNAVTIADSIGIDCIYLSYTAEHVGTQGVFRDAPIPVIVSQRNAYMNMKLVDPPNIGISPNRTTVEVTNSAHPIAAGLQGEITIQNAEATYTFGKPLQSAEMVIIDHLSPEYGHLFVYEPGDALVGMRAPAKRVLFFAAENTASTFNDLGWQLYLATFQWALTQIMQ